MDIADQEPATGGERLELLAVVRGLEALAEPAQVTLVTPSRYVTNGLTYGLDEWRTNGWTWEAFGRMVPVKNDDLWRRLDRALEVHQVHCRRFRIDSAHATTTAAHATAAARHRTGRGLAGFGRRGRWATVLRRHLASRAEALWLWFAQLGTSLLPRPWLG